MFKKWKSDKGFMNLGMLVMVSTGAAITSFAILAAVENANQTSYDFINKRRSVYAAEGGIRAVQKLANNYLAEADSPTTQGLISHVENEIGAIDYGQFSLSNFSANIINTEDSVIPSGPFKGVQSRLTRVQFALRAHKSNEKVSTSVSQVSLLGQVQLFQFFVFSDLRSVWHPGPLSTIQGRTHFNHDVCIKGNLRLSNVTSAAAIYQGDNPNCPAEGNTHIASIWDGSAYQQLLPNRDNGCVNCGGSGLDWKDYALNRWQGNLLDSAHGVPNLRLPGSSSTTPSQMGYDSTGAPTSNTGKMRILVEPVLPTDSLLQRDLKLAHKADIRIINGVWYLKDPADSMIWPGMPIWSDHPGDFTTTNEESIEGNQAVGQNQLRVARSWTATPQYFSYYEHDQANNRLVGDANGVISYGNLSKVGSGAPGTTWMPGHWVSVNTRAFCPGPLSSNRCTNCMNGVKPYNQALTCTAGQVLHPSVGLLNATRGGFRSGKAALPGLGISEAHTQKKLPLNFDMAQFQQALQQVSSGELGSYFGVGNYMGRDFNGIIYISNLWPGSLRGIDGTNTAQIWSEQGSVGTLPGINQPNRDLISISGDEHLQNSLPFNLCSNNLNGQLFSGTPNSNGTTTAFSVPNCVSSNNARPNVVRIINANNISPTIFSNGLSIVTNNQIYLQGDFNTSSNVTSATATPWLPVMVAADLVYKHSNNWDDARSGWGGQQSRPATHTTYNLAILTGFRSVGTILFTSSGVHNLLRYNEWWENIDHNVNGSIVIGFSSTYFFNGGEHSSPPRRMWNYDSHFLDPANQPPGTPSFPIYAVEDWESGQ